MFLMTRLGFYEADRVQDTPVPPIGGVVPPENGVIVRSRRREDLERLIEHCVPEDSVPEILRTPQWDYPFRIYLDDDAWVSTVANLAAIMDYRNLKHTLAEEDPERYDLAEAIWLAGVRDVR